MFLRERGGASIRVFFRVFVCIFQTFESNPRFYRHVRPYLTGRTFSPAYIPTQRNSTSLRCQLKHGLLAGFFPTFMILQIWVRVPRSSKVGRQMKVDIRDMSKSFWMTHFWKLVEIQFVFWQSPISQSMSDLDRVERTKAKLFYSSNCKISFASWKMPQRMRQRLGYLSNWCRWIFRFGSGWDEGHCPLASI